ncbi:hypothetical protein QEH59_18445 [Coraliomargarita sp. SDUM461004]|uniref:Uncharacterized protein n=1 Tax=Thalassobacterium sedimentorum TaxID=3041258 RepID=A0ABU1ANN9_9BACT|nr:hypothetical protein [Coraliomargarita sp. SDUM461004]MDQ8196415.1 hypothetical protein [Coraliomargarita sp. SDUM461004]
MKTIIQVHVFIRLCASGCIIYSLYQLIVAWPKVARLRDVIEKQKESIEMLGGTFDLGAFIPSFTEIFLGPVLLLMAGLFAFIGTKKIVELVIGQEQIKALLHSDRKGAQIQSR